MGDFELQWERDYAPPEPKKEPRARFTTKDGKVFTVPEATVILSSYLTKKLLRARQTQLSSDNVNIPDISAAELEVVLPFCYFHTSEYHSQISLEESTAWDKDFVGEDPVRWCQLCDASYVLGVTKLLELATRRIAQSIDGKTPQQLRDIYHIELESDEQVRPATPPSRKRLVRGDLPASKNRGRKQKRRSVEVLLRVRPPKTVTRQPLSESDNVELRSSESDEVQFVCATYVGAQQDDSHAKGRLCAQDGPQIPENTCAKDEIMFDDTEVTSYPSVSQPQPHSPRAADRSSRSHPRTAPSGAGRVLSSVVLTPSVAASIDDEISPVPAKKAAPKYAKTMGTEIPLQVHVELATLKALRKRDEEQARKIDEKIQQLTGEREELLVKLAYKKFQIDSISKKYKIKRDRS